MSLQRHSSGARANVKIGFSCARVTDETYLAPFEVDHLRRQTRLLPFVHLVTSVGQGLQDDRPQTASIEMVTRTEDLIHDRTDENRAKKAQRKNTKDV